MTNRKTWRPILFDCPRTGHKVQELLAEESFNSNDARYETVSCLACSGVHLVNPKTGVVLGARREDPK
jgi:hypothetical protein